MRVTAVAAAIVMVLAVGCSSNKDAAAPRPSAVAPITSPTRASKPKHDRQPLVLTVPNGVTTAPDTTYKSAHFGVPFRFTTHAMPYPFIASLDSSTFFEMDSDDSGSLEFAAPQKVYSPGSAHLVSAPSDLLAWLQSNRYLEVSTPTSTSIGGIKGEEVTVAVASVPNDLSKECDGDPCIPLFPVVDPPPYGINKAATFNLILLEVHGRSVVISIDGPKNGYASFSKDARQVLKTVEFASNG